MSKTLRFLGWCLTITGSLFLFGNGGKSTSAHGPETVQINIELDSNGDLRISESGSGTPYAAIRPNGQSGDGQTSIVYVARTGEVAVDAPASVKLTSINIDSAGGIFTGEAAANLGGSFDNDADNNIFKATFW